MSTSLPSYLTGKKYNELFPKQKREKKDKGAEKPKEQTPKKEKKAAKPKEEEEEEEEDDRPPEPKAKDPYVNLPKRCY